MDVEALECFKVRSVTALNGLLDVSRGDRRLVFTHTRELQVFPVGGLNAVPEQFQEIGVVGEAL